MNAGFGCLCFPLPKQRNTQSPLRKAVCGLTKHQPSGCRVDLKADTALGRFQLMDLSKHLLPEVTNLGFDFRNPRKNRNTVMTGNNKNIIPKRCFRKAQRLAKSPGKPGNARGSLKAWLGLLLRPGITSKSPTRGAFWGFSLGIRYPKSTPNWSPWFFSFLGLNWLSVCFWIPRPSKYLWKI